MYVCIYIYMYIHIHVHIHIHMYIHKHVIIITICPLGYHHNGFVATHALGNINCPSA